MIRLQAPSGSGSPSIRNKAVTAVRPNQKTVLIRAGRVYHDALWPLTH